MSRILPIALSSLLLLACNESSFFLDKEPPLPAPQPGAVQGRVCDPSGRTWLADALVYVHIFTEDGQLLETLTAYSDQDGYWTIEGLPPDRDYTFYVQYGDLILNEVTVTVGDGDFIQLEEPDCFDPLQINVAIITGDYDNFDRVLSQMGFANYQLIDGMILTDVQDFLMDPDAMGAYDVIFFNGGHTEEDVIYDSDSSDTEGKVPQILNNISDYVAGGGAIWGSDWAYDGVEAVWPDRVEWVGDDSIPNDAQMGEYDLVSANISDEAMASWLGTSTIEIEYDLPVWPPIESVEGSVTTHLQGTVDYRLGTETYTLADVPLLVSFTSGEGRVYFSTFRVARNSTESDDLLLVLQYMMYNL